MAEPCKILRNLQVCHVALLCIVVLLLPCSDPLRAWFFLPSLACKKTIKAIKNNMHRMHVQIFQHEVSVSKLNRNFRVSHSYAWLRHANSKIYACLHMSTMHVQIFQQEVPVYSTQIVEFLNLMPGLHMLTPKFMPACTQALAHTDNHTCTYRQPHMHTNTCAHTKVL